MSNFINNLIIPDNNIKFVKDGVKYEIVDCVAGGARKVNGQWVHVPFKVTVRRLRPAGPVRTYDRLQWNKFIVGAREA